MNFVTSYKEGQKGINVGLPLGEGLEALSREINGLQKARIYTIGAAPKVGKTTLVDAGFVIEPCLYILKQRSIYLPQIQAIEEKLSEDISLEEREILNTQYDNLKKSLQDLEIVYLSYEIDRVSKEFDYACHFLARDYGIKLMHLPQGKTHKNKNFVLMSSSLLKGELVYDTSSDTQEIIRLNSDVEEKLKLVYKNRIIPLFGEYDERGNKISDGLIIFVENRDNPTGIRNNLIKYASTKGEILYSKTEKDGKVYQRIIGFRPHNPNLTILVVTDHIRKLILERNFTIKQTMDKFSEYAVEFRNLFRFSFIHIVHLSRSMTDVHRRKLDGDSIYPTSDDIKDSGNLSEDSNYIFTMFNPNDDRYNLNKHFGSIIKDPHGNTLYPNMRTIHLVENRHGDAPRHFRVNMLGNIKTFNKLNIE